MRQITTLRGVLIEIKDFGDVESKMALIAIGEEGFWVKSFIDDYGNTWFLAFDLAYQLGYDAPAKAVEKYCTHAVYGKGVLYSTSENPIVVPPHDMYSLVLHADDADCVKFQESICDELCHRYCQLYEVVFDRGE